MRKISFLIKALSLLIFLFANVSSLAQTTYFTTKSGLWDDNDIWNNGDTNGVGGPWAGPGGVENIIQDGDTLYIDDDIVVDYNENDELKKYDVVIIIDANLDFQGGQLNLSDNTVISVTENGSVTSSGGGSSDKIKFGNGQAQWDGGNPDLIGPGTLDQNSNGALPIELSLFDVKQNEHGVEIIWVTATEENNDYFTLEKSRDGKNFKVLTIIEGAGNSFDPLSYSYVDKNPYYGQSYYRLTQTDYDGTSETFSPAGIYLSGLSEVNVFPNPVNRGESLTINHTAEEGEKVLVKLYNTTGVVILNKEIDSGQFTIQIDAELEKGLYVLKVKSGTNQFIKRLLVK